MPGFGFLENQPDTFELLRLIEQESDDLRSGLSVRCDQASNMIFFYDEATPASWEQVLIDKLVEAHLAAYSGSLHHLSVVSPKQQPSATGARRKPRHPGPALPQGRYLSGQPGGLNLLERRLVDSHSTVTIPFDDGVIFVSLLNCAEFSRRLSEVAQTLDAISGIQFLVGGRGLGERWLLGTV